MVNFEINSKDSMGRTGKLKIDKKTVKTPVLMPVLNPHLWTPDLKDIDIVITNSYIIKKDEDLAKRAKKEGIHSQFNFDGIIVTDSGAYQASVYEDLEVENNEIIQFQEKIGSDIITPFDIPTSPDCSKKEAKKELKKTINRIKEASNLVKRINAPIQGGIYRNLREKSARVSSKLGSIHPIGGVVPLLEEYRFKEIIDITMASKKGLNSDDPVHLFGAGHPMFFSLAVASGCDLFDSAAYALYAEDGRYLTPRGTKDVENMKELPCECKVCSENTVESLDFELLCQHNLNISFAEIHKIREAIHQGNLLEFTETRARSHPKLLDGLKKLSEYSERMEKYDPTSKSTFFYGGTAKRPEVIRHHKLLKRIEINGDILIDTENEGEFIFKPPFGPVPKELKQTYPVNAEIPENHDFESLKLGLEGLKKLAKLNPESKITFRHTGYEHPMLEKIDEENVEIEIKEE